jgi:H+/Cl- antiporter ClcA
LSTELTSFFSALVAFAIVLLDHYKFLHLLKPLRGTPLGFEAWERQMAEAAVVIGAIFGGVVAAYFWRANRREKLHVVLVAVCVAAGLLLVNIGVATASHYVTTEFLLDLLRDNVWKWLYFFLCCSLIVVVSCLPFIATK